MDKYFRPSLEMVTYSTAYPPAAKEPLDPALLHSCYPLAANPLRERFWTRTTTTNRAATNWNRQALNQITPNHTWSKPNSCSRNRNRKPRNRTELTPNREEVMPVAKKQTRVTERLSVLQKEPTKKNLCKNRTIYFRLASCG